ncbi:carbohydrate ABC transporter substrate-binding protein [Streptomyces sp. SID14478]|uniref:ABC transporter substrate-binding protein n=1 Tax=Streptomyces sp. SID14478 TaxID=2706073 RepID=UPI0013DAB9F7|nr:ABC transporter substrate-binding protein [Streptomyces sp. SID14478]NEB77702.1 carbohydrate ABC transporter substrate-binding protein [Streptomyces sp. SID14478]
MGNDAPSRRTALSAVLATGLGTALSACGGPSRSAGADGTVTLRYFFWGDTIRADLIDKCVAVFERDHPKVRIKTSFAAFDAFWQKLSTAAAGGNPPDVMHVDYAWIRTLGEHGVLADLGDRSGPGKEIDASTLIPSMRTAGLVAEQRVAMPVAQNAVSVQYDAATYAEAGARPPSARMDWNTYMDQCRAVSRHYKHRQFGMDNLGQNYLGLEIWLRQQGLRMWTDQGALGFGHDDLRTFLAKTDAWRKDGALAGPDTVLESLPGFPITTRRAAAELQWDNQVGGRGTLRGSKLTLGTVPTDTGRPGIYAKPSMLIGAAAKTPYLSEVAQFIDFMVNDPRVSKIVGTNMGMPPTTTQQSGTPSPDPAVRQVQAYEKEVASTLAPTPPPPADGGASLNVYLQRTAEKLFYGRVSVDEAVDLYFDQAKVVLA